MKSSDAHRAKIERSDWCRGGVEDKWVGRHARAVVVKRNKLHWYAGLTSFCHVNRSRFYVSAARSNDSQNRTSKACINFANISKTDAVCVRGLIPMEGRTRCLRLFRYVSLSFAYSKLPNLFFFALNHLIESAAVPIPRSLEPTYLLSASDYRIPSKRSRLHAKTPLRTCCR